MAVDISIENFAFVLFRKLWIRHGLSDVTNYFNSYPEIPASETECTDDILNAVYLHQLLSRFFYEQLLDTDYHEYSTSRSDFHSYFTSSCDHFSVEGLYIMEELLGNAAFIAAMGLVCASNGNFVFAHSCPMSWAMHFDLNLKTKFYKSGGWAAFHEYSAGYGTTSMFVMSFGRQYNVYEQIEQYLDFYLPKLVNVFDETTAEELKKQCKVLKTALNPITDNSKPPLINSKKFKQLIRLPRLLSVLSKIPDFLSGIPAQKISHDLTDLRCTFLENNLTAANNNFHPCVSDSKTNNCGRTESKFINFIFSKPVEESKGTSSRTPDKVSSPTKDQTGENSGTDSQNEIVWLPITCSASIDLNSTKKTQPGQGLKDMNFKIPDNVTFPTSQSKKHSEEYFGTDSLNEMVSLTSKTNTCSVSNIVPTVIDYVPDDLKQSEVKWESKYPDLSKASILIQSLDHITKLVNEHISRKCPSELKVPKSACSTETSSSRPNKNHEAYTNNSCQAFLEQFALPGALCEISNTPQNHEQLCASNNFENSNASSNPINENPADGYRTDPFPDNSDNQMLCKDGTEIKTPSKRRKKNKGKKNEPSLESEESVFENTSTKADIDEDGYSTEPFPDNSANQRPTKDSTEIKTPSKRRKKYKVKKNKHSLESEASLFKNLSTEADIDGYSTKPFSNNSDNQRPSKDGTENKTPSKRRKNKGKKNKPSLESKVSLFENTGMEADIDENDYSTEPFPDNSANQTLCKDDTEIKTPSKKREENKGKNNDPLYDSKPSIFENPSTETDLDAPYTQDQIRDLILQMLLVLGTRLYY